jgi:uncharacterized protein (TIGR02466 family)
MDNAHHIELFPTSLWRWNSVLDMNDYDAISTLEFDDKQEINFKPLEDKIIEATKQAMSLHFINDEYEIELTEMWGNVTQPGIDHPFHTHPHNIFSGIYYITPGQPTTFIDPRLQNNVIIPKHKPNRFLDNLVEIDNIPNTLVMFNSWLPHFVRSNTSDTVRKTISFNIMLRGDYGVPNSKAQVKF